MGDVERDHARGAALQQAVGEAAGRGADVEAGAPGDVDRERVERVARASSRRARRTRRLGRPDSSASSATSWLGFERQRPVAPDPHPPGAHRLGGAGPRAARARARRAGRRSAARPCGEGSAPGPRLVSARCEPQPPAIVCVALLAAAAAFASGGRVPVKISLQLGDAVGLFEGKVKSEVSKCTKGRKVRIVRISGQDIRVGKGFTDSGATTRSRRPSPAATGSPRSSTRPLAPSSARAPSRRSAPPADPPGTGQARSLLTCWRSPSAT